MYYNKYLKYKNKYLSKKLVGGGDEAKINTAADLNKYKESKNNDSIESLIIYCWISGDLSTIFPNLKKIEFHEGFNHSAPGQFKIGCLKNLINLKFNETYMERRNIEKIKSELKDELTKMLKILEEQPQKDTIKINGLKVDLQRIDTLHITSFLNPPKPTSTSTWVDDYKDWK